MLDKNFKDQSTDMDDEEEDNKVSAKDLELPDDCKWGGHKTMFSTDNDDKRGIFQTLENLTKLFEHRNVKSHRQRKAMLLRAILPNMSRTKLEQHLEAHDTVHEAIKHLGTNRKHPGQIHRRLSQNSIGGRGRWIRDRRR